MPALRDAGNARIQHEKGVFSDAEYIERNDMIQLFGKTN